MTRGPGAAQPPGPAPPIDAWDPWSPFEVAERLDGVTAPWCVVGGWALDLRAGRQRRPHEDLEIAVPERWFGEIAERLSDCQLFVPHEGVVQPFDGSAGQLALSHQTWVCRDRRWRLDVMREPQARSVDRPPRDLWVCRRDPELRLPYAETIRYTAAGVPYLRPDLVLLFKAKALRPKDVDDFASTVPDLPRPDRLRLAQRIARVHGPRHPWVAVLDPGFPREAGQAVEAPRT